MAKAEAEVRKTQVETDSLARVREAEADNTIRLSKEATAIKVESDKVVREAEAKAQALTAITEAE